VRIATLCSGIGAPEVAAKRLGWECLWSAEIEPFPSAVLAHHHPESVNLGDIKKINGADLEKPDVLVFGTPCQSFSVAGKRAGMDDPRGVLAFVALGIVARIRPAWFVFENVPGLLSSNAGRDFGSFLRSVDECGYSGAWASPDAQFFGVPQRRERVFFVGHSGDWRYPAAVLSEFSRLCGHPPPSREKGEGTSADVAPSIGASGRGTQRAGESRGQDPVIAGSHDPACTLTAREYKGPLPEADLSTVVCHTLRADGFDASEDGTGRGTPIIPILGVGKRCGLNSDKRDGLGVGDDGDPMFTLQSGAQHAIAFSCKDSGNDSGEVSPPLRAMSETDGNANAGGQVAIVINCQGGKGQAGLSEDLSPTLGADVQIHAVAFTQNTRDEVREMSVAGALASEPGMKQQTYLRQAMSVRRLMPVEAERLQGFPDSYTAITYRGKPAADGPRYKALGNSMAVPVIEYILRRIMVVSR